MNEVGPAASVVAMAMPTGLEVSPFQMFGMRYFWA
jgi:hypothetical protein